MDIYNVGIDEQLEVLRKISTELDDINDEIIEFADRMVDSMRSANGIGLAAPQVGLNKRFFVMEIEENEVLYFFNPMIIGTSEELSTYEEGCLSLPEMYGKVKRPAIIEVQAWNRRGRPFKMEASGLAATCIQHEIDHLDGKLFIDYLSDRKKDKIMKKLKGE